MNERVMQFRIGMFVIVAGLVLTMMIVWFGESPSLFRERAYVTVHYVEAPGVSEGIPVRKSGIRVGEVTAIKFEDRPGQPDGVLVTIALERKFKIRAGSVPRIARALIGDVSIDLLPGRSSEEMRMGNTPKDAPIIEGEVAPDPTKALEAVTRAFENVKGTLESIDKAAKGIAAVTGKAEGVGDLLATYTEAGKKLNVMADDMGPTLKSVRQVADNANATLTPQLQRDLQVSIQKFGASAAKLDEVLTAVKPLANDLGAGPKAPSATKFGVMLGHLSRVTYDLSLLTTKLEDGKGGLNPDGTLQKLILTSALHDDLQQAAVSARGVFQETRGVMRNFNDFALRIARDPAALTEGALRRPR